jgi:hypothetical protein
MHVISLHARRVICHVESCFKRDGNFLPLILILMLRLARCLTVNPAILIGPLLVVPLANMT